MAEPTLLEGADRMVGLVAAIAENKDKIAFAAVFEHFAPRLKGLMTRDGISEALAEEIAMKTMMAVWHEARLFSSHDLSVATWVYVLARNLGLTLARQWPTLPQP